MGDLLSLYVTRVQGESHHRLRPRVPAEHPDRRERFRAFGGGGGFALTGVAGGFGGATGRAPRAPASGRIVAP